MPLTISQLFSRIKMSRFMSRFLMVFAVFIAARVEAQNAPHPVLAYSSFLGGGMPDNYSESAFGMAAGNDGMVYVVGITTTGSDFPFTHRLAADATQGTFVVKFNPATKTIVYATLIPGCTGRAIAVDGNGSAYITGECGYNALITNAVQSTYGGGDVDAFVAKLSADGAQLAYLTFLGGSGADLARHIYVDAMGRATICGVTDSTDLPGPAPGVLRPTPAGLYDAFVAELAADGSAILRATYIGGNRDDLATGLTVDGSGNVYVCGRSGSTNFAGVAVSNNIGTNGSTRGFVIKLSADYSTASYLSFFGGTGVSTAAEIAVDGNGNAYLLGETTSTNLQVTANAPQLHNAGDVDAFVAKLNSAGTSLDYCTYLGGMYGDDFSDPVYVNNNYLFLPLGGIALDGNNNLYVAASSRSPDTVPNAATASPHLGDSDGYVAKYDASGGMAYFRNLGGARSCSITGLARAPNGRVFVTGSVILTPFPPYFPITADAFQPRYAGSVFDSFISEFSDTLPLASNDAFGNRIALTGARLTVQANNSNATSEPSEPQHAGLAGGKSLWWSWTAASAGTVEFTTRSSGFDTLLAVYTGTALGSLQAQASNDDEAGDVQTSKVRLPVSEGTTYQIAVDGKGGAAGFVSLSVTFSQPSNDAFTNSIALSGFPVVTVGSNINATLEPMEQDSLFFFGADRSVWWSWTSPVEADVAITTSGSSFDTYLGVFTGDALTNIVLAAPPSDNDTNSTTSRVTLQAHAGTTYRIVVLGNDDQSGPIQLNIVPSVPPANDNFASAMVLNGSLLHLTNYNVSASAEDGEPNLGFGLGGGRSLWFQWTAPSNGVLHVNTEGSDFDTRLGIFTGSSITNLSLVGASDDEGFPSPFQYQSKLQFLVASNTTYYIYVDGVQQNPSGTVVLNLFYFVPPIILANTVGGPLTGAFHFQVKGFPGQPYYIQSSSDLKNWAQISGLMTGPAFSFTETNLTITPRRFYRVVEAH